MGFSYYLLNKEKKVAVEVSRHTDIEYLKGVSYDDITANEELYTAIYELDLAKSLDIIEYIVYRYEYLDNEAFMLYMLIKNYGFREIIHEDNLSNDYLKLTKVYI